MLTFTERRALAEQAALGARLQAVQTQTPLALARLWRPHCTRWDLDRRRPRGCGREMAPVVGQRGVYTCTTPGCAMAGVPEVRTSQRDAIRLLGTRGLVALLLGGANRAGKSEAAMQAAVALAAGRAAPWVAAWMRLNDIPEAAIPEAPGMVVVSALTHAASLGYHRPKLDRYLPSSTRRRNWAAENQAEARLPGGGHIVCMAAAQGWEAFQGTAPVAAILDEEHPEEVFEEITRGLAETDGPCLLSMTPLKGMTWTYQRFVGEPPPGHLTDTIYGLDNPHVRSAGLIRRFAHLPPERRDARLYGKFAAARGLIYPQFCRAVHVVAARHMPAEWDRWRSIDFGFNFACLWACLDPDRDQLIVYRVLKTQGEPLGHNARQVRALSEQDPGEYELTLADPADREARIKLAGEYNIPTTPARKDVETGIDAVHERLALTPDGYPRLVITEDCAALIDELVAYQRKDDGSVKKEGDHLADCLRYLVYRLQRESSYEL